MKPTAVWAQAIFLTKRLLESSGWLPVRREGAVARRAANGEILAKTPLSAPAQESILRIQEGTTDYMKGVPQAEKKARLSRMSYKDFLLNVVKAHSDVIPFYQCRTHGLYGIGIDAVPALDCWAISFPGFQGMELDRVPSKGLHSPL